MKILVLSENEKNQKMLKESIEELSFEHIEIYKKDQIMAQIEENKPDILISEFDCHELGGLELINGILASDLHDYPYILFLTDLGHNKQVIDCLGPIPGDFINLPLVKSEIETRLVIAHRMIAFKNQFLNEERESGSLAIYDHLTKALNRQAGYERALAEVNRAQRGGKELGLAMVEIVNLPEIREKYGKEVSNQAIRYVATATRANIRIYDIVGRWIGAKFLVLLPGVDDAGSKSIFERIQKAISSVQVKASSGKLVKLDVRIGYVCFDHMKPDPLYELIEKANQALGEVQKSKETRVLQFSE